MATAEPKADPTASFAGLRAFQRDVLGVLARAGPMYGLALKRELEELYDRDVNHGQLYPNLDTLVELGLVEKGELDQRTNSYALTERGHRVVAANHAWLGGCMEESDA